MSRLTLRRGHVASVALATALAGSVSSFAQEAAAPEAKAPASATLVDLDAVSLEEVAAKLDADSFDERQAASEALARRGAEATPVLEKVSTEGSREAKSRALDLLILRAKAEGESESKTSAKEALERLAKSADAYASRRAQDALAPPPAPVETPRVVVNPGVPRFLPMGPGGVPNIRVQAIAQNGGLKIQRRNVNGEETIEAEEGDRKVKIAKTADGKIEMEIVEKKDGKETTEKVAAKDEDDLKKNAPQAYELFKKYAGPGPLQAQIIVGNVMPPGFPGGIPQFAPGAPPFAPAPAQANERHLQSLKRMLETLQRQEQRIQEQIKQLEKEMQAEAAPAEAPADQPPAEDKPVEEDAAPQDVDREAGSDANGGSDD